MKKALDRITGLAAANFSYVVLAIMAFLFIFVMLIAASASDQAITIYTGKEGGGYAAKADEVRQRLEQRGVQATVEHKAGSDEITLASCQDEASIWIAQEDALYTREVRDGCLLVDVGVYGQEFAFLLFPPESRLSKLHNLGGEHTVFVDGLGSGSELFWRTIVGIELGDQGNKNEWANAQTETGDKRRIQSLAGRGLIDAVVLVRTPGSQDIKRLLSQGWKLGEFRDKDIDDLSYNGQPLYQRERVRVSFDERTARNDVYEVMSFIGTTPAVERDVELFDAILSALE